jgi:ketosteroid isomerase-like protein
LIFDYDIDHNQDVYCCKSAERMLEMKRLTTILLTTALCTGMALAQAPVKAANTKAPAAASSGSADELRQIENDWVAAEKTRDANKLSDILADGWVGLEADGRVEDKAGALADLKALGNSLDTIEMGPMKVRFFGSTAIVTGSDTEKSTEKGKDSSGKYVWTDVFVKQNGKWKAVSSQSTKVTK